MQVLALLETLCFVFYFSCSPPLDVSCNFCLQCWPWAGLFLMICFYVIWSVHHKQHTKLSCTLLFLALFPCLTEVPVAFTSHSMVRVVQDLKGSLSPMPLLEQVTEEHIQVGFGCLQVHCSSHHRSICPNPLSTPQSYLQVPEKKHCFLLESLRNAQFCLGWVAAQLECAPWDTCCKHRTNSEMLTELSAAERRKNYSCK